MLHPHTHHRRRIKDERMDRITTFITLTLTTLVLLTTNLSCCLTRVAGLQLVLSHSASDGSYTLTDDRTPTVWGWSGIPTTPTTISSPAFLNANGVRFAAASVTPAPDADTVTMFNKLPANLEGVLEAGGFPILNSTDANTTTPLSGDTISVLSMNSGGTPSVWALKSFVRRPWVEFVSSSFVCDPTVVSAQQTSFLCTSLGSGLGYTWVANISSNLINGGRFNPPEDAVAQVTISLTTTPLSTTNPTIADDFVFQLLSIGYTKTTEMIRLNSDIRVMLSQDDSRRSKARVSVAFLWLFIMITAIFAVIVTATWIPWAIPCARERLLNIWSVGVIWLVIAILFIIIGVTQGLAGFVILLLIVMFTTAVINIIYCCLRARNRAQHLLHPVGESLSGFRNGEAPDKFQSTTPVVMPASEEETLMSSSINNGMAVTGDASGTSFLVPPFSKYPDPLGTKQRALIGWGAMSFLVAAVISVAIFGLWSVDDYLLWDRQSSLTTAEYMPQAISKATFLVYAYDGFANRIKMNHIFFDVSTQWCGAHYSTQLNTDAQKYTSIYQSFILKYSIDMNLFEPSSYTNYSTVNEWFIRKFKPGIRPLAAPTDPTVILNPCDARVMVFNHIPDDSFIWIKDTGYTVEGLIGSNAYNANPGLKFSNGAMALVRLAPQDYHRFHSPVDGVVLSIDRIEGSFHSVNADGMTSANYAIYNQRTIVVIDTAGYANIGRVAFTAIGALCVGSITITPVVGATVQRGESIGYFQFGGSTIAVVFEANRITFDADLLQHSLQKVESLVQMGTTLATKLN